MMIVIVVFALVFLIAVLSAGAGFSYVKSKQKQRIRSMLRNAEEIPDEERAAAGALLRPAAKEDQLKKLLGQFRFLERLDLILDQAGKGWKSSRLAAFSLAATAAGFLAGLNLPRIVLPGLVPCLAALLAGSLPFLLVWRQRKKNIAAFEKQFPDALDFLARSMRAGHAFSIALDLLSVDSPDPLGSAFRRVSNDLQLGSSLDTALKRLMLLAPLLDVRFFVSSVLLQQETGGNLGEILNKLSHVIRERFQLKGEVKAASAHGRITGLVLLLMPVAVTVLIMLSTPQYLKQLWMDPVGREMVYGSILGQVLGYFVIRKIVDIKV